jgi:hypothetical protein
MSADRAWDVLVALTCARMSEEVGELIIHGVDVFMSKDPSGGVRYDALTERGHRACLIAMTQMKAYKKEIV